MLADWLPTRSDVVRAGGDAAFQLSWSP